MMLDKPKILFLDDDYLLIKAVDLITRSLNYDFHLCNSVKEARLLLRSTDFQVIFSDYHMPECNGVDFLKESSFNKISSKIQLLVKLEEVLLYLSFTI